MNTVLNINNKPLLVNGKAVMYLVRYTEFTTRMSLARQIFSEYTGAFATVGEVIQMLRAYERTGDLVINKHNAYILHDAN